MWGWTLPSFDDSLRRFDDSRGLNISLAEALVLSGGGVFISGTVASELQDFHWRLAVHNRFPIPNRFFEYYN